MPLNGMSTHVDLMHLGINDATRFMNWKGIGFFALKWILLMPANHYCSTALKILQNSVTVNHDDVFALFRHSYHWNILHVLQKMWLLTECTFCYDIQSLWPSSELVYDALCLRVSQLAVFPFQNINNIIHNNRNE